MGTERKSLEDEVDKGLGPYLQGSLASLFHEYELPIVERMQAYHRRH